MEFRRLIALSVLWGSLALTPGCAAAPAPQAGSERTAAEARGRELATLRCGGCHGVDRHDVSARPEAPPFRLLAQRRDLDRLEQDFARGIVTSHPDMPLFVFRASEIDDLIAYLETLEQDR